jgi:hypothetical protein
VTPIYDRAGRVVSWLYQASILSLDARPLAFVHDGALYSYRRQYLGRFEHGLFRDRTGAAVAFIQGAQGGPLLPLTQLAPLPPLPPLLPLTPLAPIPPIPPLPSLTWSRLGWVDFIEGG